MHFMSTPPLRASDAAPCLGSCSGIGGSPASNASRWNLTVTNEGRSGLPSSRLKTRPVSVHASPHASRSATRARRQDFKTATVVASSATLASDASLLGVDSLTA